MLKVKLTICVLLAILTAGCSVLCVYVVKESLFALPFSWLRLCGFICSAYLALQGMLGILWSLDCLIREEMMHERFYSQLGTQSTSFRKKLLKVFLNSYPK